MQKWEYATVLYARRGIGQQEDSDPNAPASYIVTQVNEKKAAKYHYTDKKYSYGYYVGELLHEYLNRAGQEGWKVVAGTEPYIIVLERPIEE